MAGAVLEKGCVYIVELMERLALQEAHLGDRQPEELDRPARRVRPPDHRLRRRVRPRRANYQGPLYAEIAPRTFSVLVRRGDRLNQIRIKRGTPLVQRRRDAPPERARSA